MRELIGSAWRRAYRQQRSHQIIEATINAMLYDRFPFD
jgi:hypothetical protein